MFRNIYRSNEKSPVLDTTLEDFEKIHEKELEDAMSNWMEDCSIHDLFTHTNFEFGWLLGPRGYTAKTLSGAPFNASLCRSDKFRIVASAKLKNFPGDFDFGEMHEHKMRNCFPMISASLPTIISKRDDNWAPALENRGCSIGITYVENERKEENRINKDFYITVHTCLASPYLNEIIHEDFKADRINKEILELSKTEDGRLSNDREIITYEEVFSNSHNERALDIAKENASRLIVLYAEMFNLEIENGVIESTTRYVYEPKEAILNMDKMMEIAVKVLSKWPSNVPIYPFTVIQSTQSLLTLPEIKEGHDFAFGYYIQQLKTQSEAKFVQLKKEFKINYIDIVKTCRPNILMDYNTFRMNHSGELTWYSNTSPIEGPVLVYQGPALGFSCLNYYDDGTSNKEWANSMSNSFPVLFPCKPSTSDKFDIEVYNKCFSIKKGGLKNRNAIEQLQHMFCNLEALDTIESKTNLNIPAVNQIRFCSKKIFFSSHGFTMSRFHTEE